jgi:hypothetical protein
MSLFNLPPQRIENALTQLSGEVGTGAQLAGFQLMDQFLSLMLDPLAQGHGNGIAPVPFAPEKRSVFTPEVASVYASVLKAPPAAPISSYGPWNAWGAAYGGPTALAAIPPSWAAMT